MLQQPLPQALPTYQCHTQRRRLAYWYRHSTLPLLTHVLATWSSAAVQVDRVPPPKLIKPMYFTCGIF